MAVRVAPEPFRRPSGNERRGSEARRFSCAARLLLPALFALTLQADPAAAQPERPLSTQGTASVQIGGHFDPRAGYVNGKWIDIHYGRPLRRGRNIFGEPDFIAFLNDGAPVWRAGANYTTRLVTELPLSIDGTRLEPGEYTLFIQLGPERWTLIVSTWPAQRIYDHREREALFGAYGYTAHRDVLRTEMTLEPLPSAFEQLSWQFLDVTPEGGRLALLWERTMASVPFLVEQPEAAASGPTEGEADEESNR